MKKIVFATGVVLGLSLLLTGLALSPKATAGGDPVTSGIHVRSYYVDHVDCTKACDGAYVTIKCTAHNPPHQIELQSGYDGFVCTRYHYCWFDLNRYPDLHTGYWYVFSIDAGRNIASAWQGPYYLDLGHNSVDVLAYLHFVVGK